MKSLIVILTLLIPIISFAGSHFKTGSSEPTQELVEELKNVYKDKIKDKQVISIVVEGHTDSRGSDKLNYKLSLARAKSAAAKLVEMGADKSKITTIGKGESELLTNGVTDLDHATNRRVVIIVGSDDGVSKTVISEIKECKTIEKQIIVEKVKTHKNIISLTVNRSLSDYSISNPSSSTTRVENRHEYVPGLMYQRGVSEHIYLGIQVDTHKSVGGNIGYGF